MDVLNGVLICDPNDNLKIDPVRDRSEWSFDGLSTGVL